jgi:hypothetical protein
VGRVKTLSFRLVDPSLKIEKRSDAPVEIKCTRGLKCEVGWMGRRHEGTAPVLNLSLENLQSMSKKNTTSG